MKVIFHPKARIELLDTIAWYEERRTGLGAEFRAEVKTRLQQAVENPGRFRNLTPAIRVARLKRFPYFLYFAELANHIEVLAVVYAGRDPEWIRKRLIG
jgi:plasmid stabilization system protein ParE